MVSRIDRVPGISIITAAVTLLAGFAHRLAGLPAVAEGWVVHDGVHAVVAANRHPIGHPIVKSEAWPNCTMAATRKSGRPRRNTSV